MTEIITFAICCFFQKHHKTLTPEGLVTNYGEGGGGLQNKGGACEVLPLQKGGGGAQKVSAMLKGATNSFEGVFMW